MSDAVMVPRALVTFLLGETDLDGYWFGDTKPGPGGRRAAFWWREGIRKALAASTPVGGWEDISTAPKDGTNIDLWCRDVKTGESYHFPDSYWCRDRQQWHGCDEYIWPEVDVPTHWRPLPPPPSVSTDNGPRPQEAVPTCDAKPAVVAHSTYLSAVAGRMAFRDAYRRCLPVVQAAEALAAKWTREGQKVDSDDFYAAINDVWEAVAKRNGDPLAKDDGAYAATPQPADGCSSNEGAGK